MIRSWYVNLATLLLVLTALVVPLLVPQPATAAIVSSSGWEWQNPLLQGNDLHGVWGASASNVYAVGAGGTILHYDGSAWSAISSGTTATLNGVWGNSGTDVFAVGDGGTILHLSGSTWSTMASSTSSNLRAVWGSSGANVFAVGDSGTILRYNGTAWTSTTSGSANLNGVWGSSATNIFAVGSGGTILHYTGSWSSMGSSTTLDLHGISGNSSLIVAVGYGGTILSYDGSSWATATAELVTSANLSSVWVSSPSLAFAVGGGTVVRYRGEWGTMALQTNDTIDTLFAVWGSSASDAWAVGAAGTMVHYNGTEWRETSTGHTDAFLGLWGTSSSDLWTAGEGGYIYHYNGHSWGQASRPTTYKLWHINGTSSSDIWAVGDMDPARGVGTIAHYNGTEWQLVPVEDMPASANVSLYRVWAMSPTDVIAVGKAIILHYDGNASGTWTVMSKPAAMPDISLWGVWGTSSSDFYIAGDVGYMFHFKDGQWHDLRPTERDIILMWGLSTSNIFAVCDGGGILHFDGTAWSPMTSNTSNHLTGVWGNPSDGFFAVGDNGTILHCDSQPDGTPAPNWTLKASGTNNNFYRVWVDQTTHDAFAVGTNGMILHYRQSTPQPIVSSVTPKEAAQGDKPKVTITGSYFSGASDSTTTTEVSFGDSNIKVTGFTVDSSTQITAEITIDPKTTVGPKDVSVKTQRGTGTLEKCFTVTSAQPIVETISPNQGTQGQTMNVTLTGTYLTGATEVKFGSGITVNSMKVDSALQITANISIKADAVTGIKEVSVTTPVGTDTVSNGFTVIAAPPQNANQGTQQDTGTGDDTQAGTGTESDGSGIPVWVWGVVAVGAVALVAGVVLTVIALRRRTATAQ